MARDFDRTNLDDYEGYRAINVRSDLYNAVKREAIAQERSLSQTLKIMVREYLTARGKTL